jgi:hypothetical protein
MAARKGRPKPPFEGVGRPLLTYRSFLAASSPAGWNDGPARERPLAGFLEACQSCPALQAWRSLIGWSPRFSFEFPATFFRVLLVTRKPFDRERLKERWRDAQELSGGPFRLSGINGHIQFSTLHAEGAC